MSRPDNVSPRRGRAELSNLQENPTHEISSPAAAIAAVEGVDRWSTLKHDNASAARFNFRIKKHGERPSGATRTRNPESEIRRTRARCPKKTSLRAEELQAQHQIAPATDATRAQRVTLPFPWLAPRVGWPGGRIQDGRRITYCARVRSTDLASESARQSSVSTACLTYCRARCQA
jgi:hypothetical protein